MSNINYTTRTEGQTRINIATWTIPNFMSLLNSKTTREFRTENPKDKVLDLKETFQLKMQFHGRSNDVIEIYYLSPTPVFVKSILTVCLKRFEERSITIKEYHTAHANKWQYLATLYKRDIATHDVNNDEYLLSDGSLRLKIQFMIINDIKIERVHIPEAQLSNDFENLLNIGLFSDAVMKSAEGCEFKVHKAVLASRSVVLKAHFEHNTTECYTNTVETPLESHLLREVLTFIYSDTAPNVDEIPEKLLAAADYYQLNRLKNICEEALHKKLTVENAIETLQLADLHSAKILKQLTLEFIKDGQAKLITKTEGWAKLKSVELIKTIYEHIMADDVDADIK